MSTIEVNILLPEEVLSFARLGKEEIKDEMRRLLLLELVREGKVPYGKAAELLGIGQAEFLQYMAQHKVSPFQFTPDELAEELGPIQ
jgi:predicted HTH domain antitoxin